MLIGLCQSMIQALQKILRYESQVSFPNMIITGYDFQIGTLKACVSLNDMIINRALF